MSTHKPGEWIVTILADNLRRLRIAKGLSQTELAEAIGTSYPRISELERGKSNPTLSTLEAIANFFDTEVSELLSKNVKKRRVAG